MSRHRAVSSSEFFDWLERFFLNTDGLTTEELAEDLREQGIDVDGVLDEVEKILARYGIRMKRTVKRERCKGTEGGKSVRTKAGL